MLLETKISHHVIKQQLNGNYQRASHYIWALRAEHNHGGEAVVGTNLTRLILGILEFQRAEYRRKGAPAR